jgi:hypothetical protein
VAKLRRSTWRAAGLLAALGLLATRASAGDLTPGPPQFLPGDAADGLTDGQQHEQEIAAGGPGFLAVWSDSRSSLEHLQGEQGSGYDIYGALLDGDGNVILRSLLIDEGPGHQEKPCVAWNGQHWLVAWIEEEPVGLPTYERIRAVRVAPDGTVVDATPILIHEDDYYYSYEGPVMASSGPEGWVIAFTTNSMGLRAVHVASDGTVATPPDGVPVSVESGVDFDIAFAQGQYLIVRDGNQYTPQGFRFSPTLQYLGTKALPFADELATDGTNYLVVNTNDTLWPPALQAVLVDRTLNVVVPPITVKTGTAVTSPKGEGVGFDGTNYWVTWTTDQFARITPAGQLLDPGGITISPSAGNFGYQPAYASAPNGGLQLLWHDGGGGLGYPQDAYTARLTTAGSVVNETPASLSAPAQVEADFAKGAGTNVIVFRSRTSGAARILAHRIDDNGTTLDTEPIEVASGPVQWLATPSIDAPQVAWNGSVFMVVWSDTINVLARRMNPDGTFVDATPLVIMPGQSAAVGALGATFLVSGSLVGYSSGTLQPPGALRVSRVDGVTGAVLDAPPIMVGGASDRHPHIVTLGGRWLVVWESVTHDPYSSSVFYGAGVVFVDANGTATGQLATQLSRRPNVAVAGDRALLVAVDGSVPGGYTDLEGRILMADGSFPGPTFPISTAPYEQLRPAATWTGTEFVAAWEDQRNAVSHFDKRTDIYGARITADGVVLDPAGVPLATLPQTEMAPVFLPAGGKSLMAVSTLRSDTALGAYRIGIQRLDGGGCQPSLGFGGPGTAILSVCGDMLASGGTADLAIIGATPSSPAWVGFGAANNPTPILGGTFVPFPPALIWTLATDANGEAHLAIPGGGATAHTVYAQAVYPDLSLPQLVGFTNAVGIEILQ